jgi:hypothetical protein
MGYVVDLRTYDAWKIGRERRRKLTIELPPGVTPAKLAVVKKDPFSLFSR